ncbi:MAG TPA: UDP-N-acetylmuramoyl-L-alanyl-D-glutamate--2,6-diaminopimelate ligase [Candidatus Omnitrophota bacterium]|nr:UDP-N-acetylmuramoyl-L-alanyl-D-glutamate--2,6-diaminopimelate ligase [Candidatus Omnitrophota bacterium]
MKPLKAFLEGIPCSWNGLGELAAPIRSVQSDSRKVRAGDLFVAVSGLHVDGRQFIHEAVRRGAKAVISERWDNQIGQNGIPQFCVSNARHILGRLAACAYDYPARKLKCIGITGTNGKTTTAFLIQHLINAASRCGLVGSIYYDDGRGKLPSTHTTPAPETLHETLAQMVDRGLSYCVMEVSSHALSQDRTEGIEFSSAVFTNLTQDHLDYHRDFEDYFTAKRKLFLGPSVPEHVVINRDDSYGARLIEELAKANRRFVSFGIKTPSDYSAAGIQLAWDHIDFELSAKGSRFPVSAPLILRHNIYNALAALGAVSEEGFPLLEMIRQLADFRGVSGRMERIEEGQDFYVFVDYAHTPDGLFHVLSSLEALSKRRVISVFGCGGDRDPGKRPLMGQVASRFSDVVILTSDNSRSERPEDILGQIKAGIDLFPKKADVRVLADRKEAIGQAIEMAESGDVILIFGKGHEHYQIIGEEKIPFQDQEVARYWLKRRCSPLAKS